MPMRAGTAIVAMSFVIALNGCSSGGGTNTVLIQGEVTLDSVPLDEGRITFIPNDDKNPRVIVPVKEGKFTAKVSPGAARVEINANLVKGKERAYADDPNSPWKEIVEERLPPRYNQKSELKAEIKSGENPPFQFPLKSRN